VFCSFIVTSLRYGIRMVWWMWREIHIHAADTCSALVSGPRLAHEVRNGVQLAFLYYIIAHSASLVFSSFRGHQ
jgi:hypothetical protein